jgi:type II secretory pathway pseudopilin PulG
MRTPPTATPLRPSRRASRRRDAFTLIELVAVMGIILMMTLVVVGSYVGITRAIAARSGINQLSNAVMLTRQHACMDGRRTYLFILNESEFVICRRAGRVTSKEDPWSDPDTGAKYYPFRDAYSDLGSYINELDQQKGGLRVYDFDLNDPRPYADVGNLTNSAQLGWVVRLSRTSKFSVDLTKAEAFQAGHNYGIEVYSRRSLPRGYTFVNGKSFVPIVNYFEPDGTPGGKAGGQFAKIVIIETINPGLEQSVWVDGQGKIQIETSGTGG